MVLKHLASGGMADVLLGRSDGIEGFERHVVLKRIRPQHAKDERFIQMFLDEARVAASLHHQHIVQVHDIGESDGEYFIAMEYLHGEDVRTILSNASRTRAHVPIGYAIAIVSAAAAGLHYAHERRGLDKRPIGIVHRDISPSNVLVGYDGSIKIVDFGIAKASRRHDTRSGSLKGKVSYMSPEQCRSADVDRRSDVYSLGVVLYELATTTRLFRGDNDYLVMDQIVNGRVSLPRVRRPDLPNELSAIIMRAIATDPERRYFTADELRVALDHFAAKAGLTASPSSLAAYMCKQFGERPEPWLELKGQVVNSLDEVPTTVGQGRAQSWTELPRADDIGRRSSGAIARASGPIRAAASEPVEAANAPDQAPAPDAPDDAQRISAERSLLTPSPTDSRMGWESQRRSAPPPRGITPIKVAIVCIPLIVLLGIAVWRLAGTGATSSPVAAVATQAAAPVEATAPAPVVTPIPVPPPPPRPAPVPEPTKQIARAPEAPAASKRSTSKRGQAAKITDTFSARSEPSTSVAQPPLAPTPPPPPSAPATSPPSPAVPPGAPTSSPQGVAAAAVQSLSPPSSSPSAAASAAPASSAAAQSPSASAAAAPGPNASAPSTTTATPSAPPAAPPQPEGPAQIAHTVVEHVASAHLRELSKCDGDDMHGELTVQFIVDSSGKVTKAQLASAVKRPKLAACILRSVQKWQFPKQGPTGAQGTYTLSFQ